MMRRYAGMCDFPGVWVVAAVLVDRVAYGMVSCDSVCHCEYVATYCVRVSCGVWYGTIGTVGISLIHSCASLIR